MQKLLIVEDEPRLRTLLVRLLEAAGYSATGAGTGSEAVRAMMSEEYDLVLLDLNLPDLSGQEVLRVLLAAKPAARVIVLSSVAEVGPRIQLLESGAADFMLKPFVNAELLARIRLRIRSADGTTPKSKDERLPVSGQVYVDVHRRELHVGETRVPLSHREFTLLTHLVKRRGNVCSRQELLADVWGLGFDPGTNVVDVYVRRLRSKLSADAIETVRNVGYRLIAC